MTNLTAIRLRVLPRFPARIVGANGFAVVRDGAELVVQPDYEQLAVVASVPDQDETFFQAWTRDIDTYNTIPFSALVANIQDVIIGANLSSIDGLTTFTDSAIYFTAEGESALYTLTDYARTLSGSEDAAAFRGGLGLGSAAVQDASAFATAAQGTLADSALQGDDIGAVVQAQSPILQNIVDGVTPFGDVVAANNLSDIPDKGAARGNLELGTAAVLDDGDVSLIVETTSEATLEAAITQAAADVRPVTLVGTVATDGISTGGVLRGATQQSAVLERTTGTSQGVSLTADGAELRNIVVDNKASVGPRAGHGVRTTADDINISNVLVRDFGSMDGLGGGTGALVFQDVDRPQRPRIFDSRFVGNTSSQITIGWLFEDTDYGFAGHILAEDIVGSAGIGYAHEVKNDGRWTNMHALTAVASEVAFAYGQEGIAIGDGAKFNLLTGLLADGVDSGYVAGRTAGNLLVGALVNADGRPGSSAQSYAVDLQDASKEAIYSVLNFGAGVNARAVLMQGASSYNFVQVANHAESTTIARILGTSNNNVIDVSHPGALASLLNTINDTSGAPYSGTGANVVYSNATGEWLGTLSGRFRWYLGNPGATFSSAHRFQFQRDGTAVLSFGTPSAAANAMGIAHAIPGDSETGSFIHSLGASRAADVWNLAGWGVGNRYIWEQSAYRPGTDNAVSLGTATFRWSIVYAGTGTINTSDEREKTDIEELNDAEIRVAASLKKLIRKYRWKSAVEEKGDDARIHVGAVAQEVVKAFEAEGLDAMRYGIVCYDEWDASDAVYDSDGTLVKDAIMAGNRYGIRYDELLAFIIAAI